MYSVKESPLKRNWAIIVSPVLFVCAVAVGAVMVASALGGWNGETVMAPVRLMVQFYPSTIVALMIAAACFYWGNDRPKRRYLFAVGTGLLSVYWIVAAAMVVKLINDVR